MIREKPSGLLCLKMIGESVTDPHFKKSNANLNLLNGQTAVDDLLGDEDVGEADHVDDHLGEEDVGEANHVDEATDPEQVSTVFFIFLLYGPPEFTRCRRSYGMVRP
jgi:hypothetical protein